MLGVEAAEEGEVDASAPAPTKVHIRGLDNLSHDDILKWAEEYYTMDLFKKLQWIDDTSANLIYDTEVAAAEALNAFSAEEVLDPLQLRQAKRLSTHRDLELLVRQAIVADVKAPGAKDRSKFYLFRKEWDPDNPDNIRPDNRKRRRVDEDRGDSKYRRRDYGDDQHHRRGSRSEKVFHEDMYGDDPQAGDESRRNSHSSGSEYVRRQVKYDEDLLANKERGRLRNRSASPNRDEDGRFGFDEVQPRRRTARPRSPTPRNIRAGRDNRGARDNLRKELFPDKRSSTALTNEHTNGISRDLFSNRPSSSNSSRELFPDRVNGAVHRRQSAKDLTPNEVADAIGRYTFDGASEHRTYCGSGRRPENGERRPRGEDGGGRDLFSRISGGPKVDSVYGRLHGRPALEDGSDGFSIKGAGRADNDAGFSILGASRERAQNPLVKELFPLKAESGSGEKDLFDGRIKGRGAQRRRAEDLF